MSDDKETVVAAEYVVLGAWTMASAGADNGQKGLAISCIPLNNVQPFVLIIQAHTLKDFQKQLRDGINFVNAGKIGPVQTALIEGETGH